MLMVLTVVVIASVIGLSYLSITSVRLSCSSNLMRASRAMYLAESGVQHGLWLLRADIAATTSATAANPLGPYQLDSDAGQYTVYAEATGVDQEYQVVGTGTFGGIKRTSRAVAKVSNQFSQKLLAMGPSHYWRMGESNGAVAWDLTGSHNGKYRNSPLLGQPGSLWGDLDTAVHFDGTDDYVDLQKVDMSGNRMTMLCWFKADDFHIDDLRFLSKADGIQADDHLWMLGTVRYINQPVLRMRLRTTFGSTTTVSASTGVLEAGQWTMATATYDGLWIRLYKNSEMVGYGIKLGNIAQDNHMPAWIGGNPDGETSRPFHGTIDEVAIFSKALTASQIDELYRARAGSVQVVKWEQ